jgi:hypothetical protein
MVPGRYTPTEKVVRVAAFSIAKHSKPRMLTQRMLYWRLYTLRFE